MFICSQSFWLSSMNLRFFVFVACLGFKTIFWRECNCPSNYEHSSNGPILLITFIHLLLFMYKFIQPFHISCLMHKLLAISYVDIMTACQASQGGWKENKRIERSVYWRFGKTISNALVMIREKANW
jgi:hypothetical protein